MTKSELFSSLPDVSFAEKDPDIITSELISAFETLSDRTLAPGDPVRVFFDSIILAIIQLRNCIDKAAKMNLLAYAAGDYLDQLGALLGVSRLEATAATCKVQFHLAKSQDFDVIIPAGTRITYEGTIYFATEEAVTIPKGEIFALVNATCTQAGTIGNGYLDGQIKFLVDVFPYEMTAQNYTPTSGGTDRENDENFRERIQIAPESFSNAGSKGAYEFFTKSAHADIADVAILTPPETEPGHVKIIPLLNGGEIPTDEIIEKILSVVNADNIRPDTDYVTVEKPEKISYDVEINYWISKKNQSQSEAIQSAVEESVKNFVLWQKSALGRFITPSKLYAFVMNAGACRCDASLPKFKELKKNQVATAENVRVNFKGFE